VVKRRHQAEKDTSPRERLAEEHALVAGAHHIVATCTDEVRELLALGADADRVSVVPCGVDLRLFRPDGPRERRPRPRRHRVAVVGRLVERKGIADVIAALPALPDVELVVAGGPEAAALPRDPEAARLLRLACTLGVADRVELRGRIGRRDVAALLRSADVVACVPWYEPFGIVPLEAMACGVPVVAAAVGGLTDTVVDGVTGLHVPARRPEAIAAAVASLLRAPRLRAALGAAGAARARRR